MVVCRGGSNRLLVDHNCLKVCILSGLTPCYEAYAPSFLAEVPRDPSAAPPSQWQRGRGQPALHSHPWPARKRAGWTKHATHSGYRGVKWCPMSAVPPTPPSALCNRHGGNQRRGRLCRPASCTPRILTPPQGPVHPTSGRHVLHTLSPTHPAS